MCAVGVCGELPDAVLEESLLFLCRDAEDFQDGFTHHHGPARLSDDQQFALPHGRFRIAALMGSSYSEQFRKWSLQR